MLEYCRKNAQEDLMDVCRKFTRSTLQLEVRTKNHVHAKKEVLLFIWWSVHGVEYWELPAEGCTVTADVYIEQLRNLTANLENARLQQHEIYFRHENARSHIARTTKVEVMLDHFTTPTVFPGPGSLQLPPFFLSPTSSGWARLPNPR
ncbi:hypothetical protein RB195_012007 [Necator americanus]|uniref:Transposase n=1 Tax=Necator americanus TaxID=51031 RepID=A0ABR1D594_NECAM